MEFKNLSEEQQAEVLASLYAYYRDVLSSENPIFRDLPVSTLVYAICQENPTCVERIGKSNNHYWSISTETPDTFDKIHDNLLDRLKKDKVIHHERVRFNKLNKNQRAEVLASLYAYYQDVVAGKNSKFKDMPVELLVDVVDLENPMCSPHSNDMGIKFWAVCLEQESALLNIHKRLTNHIYFKI